MIQSSPLSTDLSYLSAAHLSLLVSFLPNQINHVSFQYKVIAPKGSPPALEIVKIQDEPSYIKRVEQIYDHCIKQISNKILFTEERPDTLSVIKHPVLFFELNKQGLIYVSYRPQVHKGFSAEFAIKLIGDPATTF